MTVTVSVYEPDLVTLVAVLDQPYGVEWAVERRAVGGGQFSVPHDSPVLLGNPGLLATENVVVVDHDGVEFGFLVRRRSRARGPVWDPVTVAGEGVLEVLRSAVVYKAGGLASQYETDERVFGWMSIDFDDDGWLEGDDLESLGTWDAPDVPNLPGRPEGWPDPQAEWLWTRPTTGDPQQHPAGVCYFRRVLQVGAGQGGRCRVHVAAANRFVLYLDGVEVASGDNYQRMHTADITLADDTDHVIAAEVVNQQVPAGFAGQNVGAFIMSVSRLDDADRPTTDVIYRTFTPAVAGPGAPGPWKALDYPDPPPGVTPGFVLGRLFDEWQARGGLAAVVRDFDDDEDSAGHAWQTSEVIGTQVAADSVLSVAERLADLDVDVALRRVGGQWTFSAWQPRGQDRTGTVTVPLGGVRDLGVETDDELVNVLLVRHKYGWLELPDPPVTSGRREGFLSLGLTPTELSAMAQADKIRGDFTVPSQVIRWVLESGTVVPHVDYELGDLIVGPDLDPDVFAGPWEEGPVRVDALVATLTDTGEVVWTHETSRAGS